MDNETLVTANTSEIVVGAVSITLGLFGITENVLTAILMATDSEMRSPTYLYMINLNICDAIALVPLAFYSALALLIPGLSSEILIRTAAYLLGVSWTC